MVVPSGVVQRGVSRGVARPAPAATLPVQYTFNSWGSMYNRITYCFSMHYWYVQHPYVRGEVCTIGLHVFSICITYSTFIFVVFMWVVGG